MSYGFIDRVEQIQELNTFLDNFKSSQYRDDVLYELGNTYINSKVSNGIQTYDRLDQEFPRQPLHGASNDA
jgi:hypothetical protein